MNDKLNNQLIKSINNVNLADINNLIKFKGINVNQKDAADGFTALHIAAKSDKISIVCLLIVLGADFNQVDNKGRTALQLAKENFDYETETVKLLENIISEIENKPESESSKIILKFHLKYWSQNLNINKKFIRAIHNNNITVVEELLPQGANENYEFANGHSVLNFVTEKNYHEIATLLLNRVANVNIGDNGRTTTLDWVIKNENLEILQLLLDNGLDKNGIIKLKKHNKIVEALEERFYQNLEKNIKKDIVKVAQLKKIPNIGQLHDFKDKILFNMEEINVLTKSLNRIGLKPNEARINKIINSQFTSLEKSLEMLHQVQENQKLGLVEKLPPVPATPLNKQINQDSDITFFNIVKTKLKI